MKLFDFDPLHNWQIPILSDYVNLCILSSLYVIVTMREWKRERETERNEFRVKNKILVNEVEKKLFASFEERFLIKKSSICYIIQSL